MTPAAIPARQERVNVSKETRYATKIFENLGHSNPAAALLADDNRYFFGAM
jgi:hypothetical protein